MNLPTKITMFRIFLIPVFVVVFFINSIPDNRLIALAIFAIASFTDFLDGYIARKYNLVTDLGKFLDPIADKLLVTCALLAILIDNGQYQLLFVICSMIIISRELAIGAFRLIASNKQIVIQADKWGKIKTIFQMFALIVLIPAKQITFINYDYVMYVGVGLISIATLLTIVSGINYFVKNRSVFRTKNISDKIKF